MCYPWTCVSTVWCIHVYMVCIHVQCMFYVHLYVWYANVCVAYTPWCGNRRVSSVSHLWNEETARMSTSLDSKMFLLKNQIIGWGWRSWYSELEGSTQRIRTHERWIRGCSQAFQKWPQELNPRKDSKANLWVLWPKGSRSTVWPPTHLQLRMEVSMHGSPITIVPWCYQMFLNTFGSIWSYLPSTRAWVGKF